MCLKRGMVKEELLWWSKMQLGWDLGCESGERTNGFGELCGGLLVL